MMKIILFFIKSMKSLRLFWYILSAFPLFWFTYAQSLAIWGDRNVVYNSLTSVSSTYSCPTWSLASKIEWFDWPTRLAESDTGYTFIATSPFDLTALLTCFPSWLTGEDIIHIGIQDPIISAGSDSQQNSWDMVNLIATVSDTPCTTFNYQREQISWPDVEIQNSWAIMSASPYSDANFIFPDTTEDVVLKVFVTPQSCYHSSHTYSWIVVYSKQTSGGWWGGWWGWSSYAFKMQEEAKTLFYTTGNREAITLKLLLNESSSSPLLDFSRNSIGWVGQVYYVLEYSTWSDFSHIQKYETTANIYTLYKNFLDQWTRIGYFRVKAWYQWYVSKYSNIVRRYADDFFHVRCTKKCLRPVVYDDVFLDVDVLLAWIFSVKCISDCSCYNIFM